MIAAGGGSLAYANIARANNASSGRLTLSYAGDGDIDPYNGVVVTDLAADIAAGFERFTGGAEEIIGTGNDDVLGGSAETTLLRGGGGDDTLTITALDGVTVEGDGGDDTLGYLSASNDVTLDASELTENGATASFTSIETALIEAADGLSSDIAIDASAFTGSAILQGGDGDDMITGTTQGDYIVASGGTDSIVGGGGGDTYAGEEVAGDWSVADTSGGAGITVTKPGGTDTLTGDFVEVRLVGDDSDNSFDASGLTGSMRCSSAARATTR